MISVICPVYNEGKYIRGVLDFFTSALPHDKELFIIDGGSTDNTIDIVKEYADKNTDIHLLHNSKKYVPFALNLAIPKCKGDIIVRLDAHSTYGLDYFLAIQRTFLEVDAEIVGGPMIATGSNFFQRAVAFATSVPFGVGNSNFHFSHYKGYTDSVYLGAWKAKIFEKTGLFDEALLRNQDDEFHYRAKSMGFKIYQNPEIAVTYFPRDSPRLLFKQYFQYGLFKPKVLRKIKSEIKMRHLVPFFFFSYLLTLPVAAFYPLWTLPLLVYFLVGYANARGAGGFKEIFGVLAAFFIIHTAYGAGFLVGLFKK